MQPNAYNTPQKVSEIPIHDIKGLVEVQDYSLYWFIALIVLAIAVVVGAFMLYRYFKKAKGVDHRKLDYEALVNIDFSSPKEAAYAISRYGLRFREDSPRHTEVYDNLLSRLDRYKYKKVIDKSIDQEAKGYYDIYVGMIDV